MDTLSLAHTVFFKFTPAYIMLIYDEGQVCEIKTHLYESSCRTFFFFYMKSIRSLD